MKHPRPDSRRAPARRRPLRAGVAACAFLLGSALHVSGCRAGRMEPLAPLRPGEARAGRAAETGLLQEGKRVYREYCAGCHGERGDGQGPAARFLDPKPRDFTQGVFKFASVPSGELPRDEDLMRTLVRGLPGSSMPSWQLLPEGERRAVIAWIKTYSPAWSERGAGHPFAVSPDPYGPGDPEAVRRAVERGRTVYHVMATCWQCHAAYAGPDAIRAMAAAEKSEVDPRPDADRPEPVVDAWGGTLLPTEFTTTRLKNGSSVQDLYRTIAAGIGGTAMPSWKDALEENDLWALAYYVKSLADRRWRRPQAIPSEGSLAAAPGPAAGGAR